MEQIKEEREEEVRFSPRASRSRGRKVVVLLLVVVTLCQNK